MIPRRKFLGSIAAGFAAIGAAGPVANCFGVQDPFVQNQLFDQQPAYGTPVSPASVQLTSELNWQCKTINTLPHGPANRAPVVTGVCIDGTGNLIAVVGDDHYVSVFDLQEDRFVHEIDKHTDWVRAARFSPDGQWLATAGNDRRLMLWNNRSWSVEDALPTFIKDHDEAIIEIAFSHDSSKLATVGFENGLRVYDTKTGTVITTLDCACPDNHAVAFSHDGSMLAAGGRNGVIRVWQTSTWNLMTEYNAHRQRIRSIEFDPSGRILSCGDDQLVRITSPVDAAENRSLPRHPCKLYDVALLGGDTIATSGSDNRIHIWRLGADSEIGTLDGHTGTVSALAVSGSTLVSGSYDTQVKVWSMERQASLPFRNASTRNAATGNATAQVPNTNGWSSTSDRR